MRAVTYAAFGGPLAVTEVPDPVAPDGGVVVRVEASGLCRSDWHGWQGHDSDIVRFPHVPGHEWAGTVAAVGAGVDAGWVGRRVTAPFVQGCGACAWCRRGEGQVCPAQRQPGFSDPGSFAEYVVVRAAEHNLIPLPDELDAHRAAGLGCRVATAYRAVVARARVGAGDRVAVVGAGGVGLAAVAIAASRGAYVTAVDVSPGPLARARAAGAEAVATGWDGLGPFEVTVDAVGSPEACREAILALDRRGRHVQVGLLPPAAGRPEIPMERVLAWELDLLGSHGMAAGDYPALLAEVASGALDLDVLQAEGPPLTLEEAAVALPALGTSPSAGIRTLDPWR